MNKKMLRFAGWALGFTLAVAGVGTAVGASYAASEDALMTNAASGDALTFNKASAISGDYDDAWAYAFTKGANGIAPAPYDDGIRVYNAKGSDKYGGVLTISPKSANSTSYITGVSFTVASGKTPSLKVKTSSTESGLANSMESDLNYASKTSYSWTTDATDVRFISFTSFNDNTSGYTQWIVSAMTITYVTPVKEVTAVSISPNDDTTLSVGQSKEYTVSISGTGLAGDESVTVHYDEVMLDSDAFSLSHTSRKNGEKFTVTANEADGAGELYVSYGSGDDEIISTKVTLYSEAAKVLSSLSLAENPSKTTYVAGEAFDPSGAKVMATYEDGSDSDVTSSVVWSPNVLGVDTESVTGSYTENGVTRTVSVAVSIEADYVTSISFDVSKAKRIYYVGDEWNASATGVTAKASYVVGGEVDLASSAFDYSGYNLSEMGKQTVTVSYPNSKSSTPFSATYEITVKEPIISIGKQYLLTYGDYVMTGVTDGTKGEVTKKNGFYLASYPLTIEAGSTEDTYSFKNGDGEYLQCNTTAASKANNLWLSTTKDAKSSWYITEQQDGSLLIANANTTDYPRSIRFNSNSTQERFACYVTSSTEFPMPKLVEVTDKVLVGSFIEACMKMEQYSGDATYDASRCATNYDTASKAYALLTEAQKTVFATDSDFADAKERFSAWCVANGDSFNIVDGSFARGANAAWFLNSRSNETGRIGLVIVLVAAGAVAAIGICFANHKRKKN